MHLPRLEEFSGFITGCFSPTSVHEFSAILAHELAHLSQRHFARGLEDSRKAGVISIAGLLAGAIIAAYGGGDRHRSNDYKPRAHAGTAPKL